MAKFIGNGQISTLKLVELVQPLFDSGVIKELSNADHYTVIGYALWAFSIDPLTKERVKLGIWSRKFFLNHVNCPIYDKELPGVRPGFWFTF